MPNTYASRMGTVHRSFIREILKVTADPSIISFAGGLPNPRMFPVEAMKEAAVSVLGTSGPASLQYSTTEGDPVLREFIAGRYSKTKNLSVTPDDLIVTTGSQQCLDLVGKVFLNKGDKVVIESPGYLGAIQSFSLFEPEFVAVPLESDGPDLQRLEEAFADGAKVFYAVPNFQNPSGLSYSLEKRRAVAKLLDKYGVLFVEDDPYGELRFKGEHLPTVHSLQKKPGILLGSFSKIAAPGFRIGWLVASGERRDKLIIAKQAADLHTSTVTQAVMREYVLNNDVEEHIRHICEVYGSHRDVMVAMIDEYFPDTVETTRPDGGMFLWVTLPKGCSSMELFDKAIERKVAFVPGKPFYTDGGGENTLRLNFSNAEPDRIEEGIKRLAESIREFVR
ncbi:PLP-dependent aminotransferase family protein [Pseudodesulfovibrio senegalensis]|uniref:PLP-dependent aminotransferase family protein n=1 Tax=Pseudodesulfovibrio senegalensis TaxID=1721087 RepID=A0A6N6N5K6_9BACT|nr:PLP-dependent aminotransferase family protein [Pseudodesulfovibrio senegalensis]KAB1443510.1 PLP-dependent aminotransferase family protein [Pseudodesulfovibrio senegalensis]